VLNRAAFAPRKKNAPRPAWKVAEAYKQWLRGRPCAMASLGCCMGPMVAAHVDHAGGKGMGTKVADRHCIPLCDTHHTIQHRAGWRTFEKNLPGRDAVRLAETYWRAWPGRKAWEAKNG
jgi:hypothetical protein